MKTRYSWLALVLALAATAASGQAINAPTTYTDGNLITLTGTSHDQAVDTGVQIGTSGHNVPALDGNNTWSGTQTHADGTLQLNGATSGTTTVKAPATGGGTATFFPGSDTVTGNAATQTLTSKTIDGGSNTLTNTTTGGSTSRVLADKLGDILSVKDIGLVGDDLVLATGAIVYSVSGTSFTVTGGTFAGFVPADAGKRIAISGAGTSGSVFVTTIQTWVSATQVTLAASAPTSLTNVSGSAHPIEYGTDNSSALNTYFASNSGAALYFPPGVYGFAGVVLPKGLTTLTCAAPTATTLRLLGGSNTFLMADDSYVNNDTKADSTFRFSNCMVDGNAVLQTGTTALIIHQREFWYTNNVIDRAVAAAVFMPAQTANGSCLSTLGNPRINGNKFDKSGGQALLFFDNGCGAVADTGIDNNTFNSNTTSCDSSHTNYQVYTDHGAGFELVHNVFFGAPGCGDFHLLGPALGVYNDNKFDESANTAYGSEPIREVWIESVSSNCWCNIVLAGNGFKSVAASAPAAGIQFLTISNPGVRNDSTPLNVSANSFWSSTVAVSSIVYDGTDTGIVPLLARANAYSVFAPAPAGPNVLIDLQPATTIANALPVKTSGILAVTDEDCAPAILYDDGTSHRRISDSQVASTSCDSHALLAHLTQRASPKLQAIIANTYQQLSDAGLLSKLTGLWVHAMPDQADALINWITPGTHDETVTGTPIFSANQGFTGNGTDEILETGGTVAGFGLGQDDISVGVYVLSSQTGSATAIIGKSHAGGRQIYMQSYISGPLLVRLNSTGASNTLSPARYTGMFTLSRDNSASFNWTLDDGTPTSITRASVAPNSGTIEFLGTTDTAGSEFSNAKVAFDFVGHSLTASDIAHLRAILVDYFLVRVGAVTPTVANLPPALDFQGQTYSVPDLGGGAALLESDGTNWFRTGHHGYEARTFATGSETLTYLTNAGNVEYTQNLTGNVTVTLSATDAKGTAVKKGAEFLVTRSGTGAFTFAIVDGGSGTPTLITFPSGTAKAARCVFDGAHWRLMQDAAL